MNIKRNKKGFTLLEMMMAAAILVFAITAALKVYLDSSLLVAQSQSKTRAVTHAKMIAEEIRSWNKIADNEITGQDWLRWLSKEMGVSLLPVEAIQVQSQDWVAGQSTSPRKVTIDVSWQERGRTNRVSVIGGFL